MKKVTWGVIKELSLSKGLPLQCVDTSAQLYTIEIYDGPQHVAASIEKTTPRNIDQIDFEDNYLPTINGRIQESSAFSSKTIGIKKLFKRVTGIQVSVNVGTNTITYPIPFPWVKITGIEIINGSTLDTASLYILDTASGTTYTGYPNNTMLNQFGYNVNISKDYYSHKSEFDADLYQNMQIKLVYESTTIKNIGINFILTEVK